LECLLVLVVRDGAAIVDQALNSDGTPNVNALRKALADRGCDVDWHTINDTLEKAKDLSPALYRAGESKQEERTAPPSGGDVQPQELDQIRAKILPILRRLSEEQPGA
jgi:hypothetical protein